MKNTRNIKKLNLLKPIIILLLLFTFNEIFTYNSIQPLNDLRYISLQAINESKNNSYKSVHVSNNQEFQPSKYEPLQVSWARTKEPVNAPIINTLDSNGKDYWSTKTLGNGRTYKVLDNYPGKAQGVQIQQGVIQTYRSLWGSQSVNNIIFDYDTVKVLLNPTETANVWDGRGENRYFNGYVSKIPNLATYPVREFATWQHYGPGESWRLFSGEFQLPENMTNKRVYLGVLGENGPQLIMPLNDFMMVLVDGQPTDINFTTQATNDEAIKIQITGSNNEKIIKDIKFRQAYHRNVGNAICTLHNDVSLHTDTWHAHLSDNESTDQGNITFGDISKYLNTSKTHKIDILCGDNSGGGGTTKLDVFIVNEPSIEVNKEGYLYKGEDKILLDENTVVYPGESVYYDFKLKNTGRDELTNISFEDKLVNVLVNEDGVFKLNDNTKLNEDNLQVIKYNVKDQIIDDVKGRDSLNLLKTLNIGETILIRDKTNIKYNVTMNDIKDESVGAINRVENIVIGKAKYFNKNLTSQGDSAFMVQVEKPSDQKISATIKKYVEEVIRGDNTIYIRDNVNNEEMKVPDLLPGDKVTFSFYIKNSTTGSFITGEKYIPLTNLSLSDLFSEPYKGTEPAGGFIFKGFEIDENNKIVDSIDGFDGDNFEIEANNTIKVIAEGWIVPEPKVGWKYNLVNTVDLYYRKGSEFEKILGTSSVDLKIASPSLYIRKVISSDSLVDDLKDRTFTINITGSDSSQFNVEAIVGKDYRIDNLVYGVTYTISEVVPMNYELVSITFNKSKDDNTKINDRDVNNGNVNHKEDLQQQGLYKKSISGTIVMNGDKNNICAIIENKRVNDKNFYDESKVINTFRYKFGS